MQLCLPLVQDFFKPAVRSPFRAFLALLALVSLCFATWHSIRALEPTILPADFFQCRGEPFDHANPTKTKAEKPFAPDPYIDQLFDITIVLVARNDDYGGGSALARLQAGLDILDYQIKQHKVNLELILVEWNPDKDPTVPNLKDVISVPPHVNLFRIITVPPSLHDCWTHVIPYSFSPVLEFIAKNIGIRRSHGNYILPKAMDTVLSSAWWEYYVKKKHIELDRKHGPHLHRLMRIDCSVPLPTNKKPEEVSSYLGENIQKIYGFHGEVFTDSLVSPEAQNIIAELQEFYDKPYMEASGDFQLMSKENWERVKGYVEVPTYMHWDSVLLIHAKAAGISYYHHLPPEVIYHPWHERNKNQKNWLETNWYWYWWRPTLQSPNDLYWGHPWHSFAEVSWRRGVLYKDMH